MKIDVSNAGHPVRIHISGTGDCDQWTIDTNFKSLEEPVVQLEYSSVLSECRTGRSLQEIELVTEFEMEDAFLTHIGIVRIEWLLCLSGKG
jgi:hypothetical protein